MSVFEKLFPQPAKLATPGSLTGTTWTLTQPAGDVGITATFESKPFNEVTVTIDSMPFQGYWVEESGGQFSFQLPQNGTPLNYSNVFYGTHANGQATGVFIGLTSIQPFAMTKNS